MNIVLTGFMGTGKTVIGKLLAQKLSWEYIDTDELIEKRENMKISDIFATKGEPYFRKIETEVVKDVSKKDKCVISTGGGVVLKEENMIALEKNGIIINLSASPEIIFERTSKDKSRPLLNKENPKEEIMKLLNFRAPYYDRCALKINTDDSDPEKNVRKILDFLKSKCNFQI
ncbi:MAG: shikimate kinase [Endomicrobiia bacterium]